MRALNKRIVRNVAVSFITLQADAMRGFKPHWLSAALYAAARTIKAGKPVGIGLSQLRTCLTWTQKCLELTAEEFESAVPTKKVETP